jgi:integrase
LSIADAKLENYKFQQQVKNGEDPATSRQQEKSQPIKNINDLFKDLFESNLSLRLKHPEIPKRIFEKDIAPEIGKMPIEQVNPRDVRAILNRINNSGRPSIANDALMLCKQLFRHGVKLDVMNSNPAEAFALVDAGGAEKSRTRSLSFEEVKTVFQVLKENSTQFTRENYLACALLLLLGVRKGELIAAQWREFDFDKNVWQLPKERSKTGVSIKIPLVSAHLLLLEELKVRSCGSEYLFPARKQGKRRAYISDDTLNHALAKMFGMKVDSNKKPYANVLGQAGIEHFTIHDLRRTCRSLLSEIGIPSHIAERCLNHKIKGVEGVYDRYDYFDERREALESLSLEMISFILIT